MANVNNKDIANADGRSVRIDIENTFKAVASNNYGPRNLVGELLPCEFYADATANKLYIRSTTGSSNINNANLYEVGDLNTKHLGLLKAGAEPDTDDDDNATVSGQIFGADQTALAPSFSFANDPNTGMYRVGSDNLGFAVGGKLRAEVDGDGLKIFSNDSGSNRVKKLFLFDRDNDQSVSLRSPNNLGGNYTLTFPSSLDDGGFLQVDQNGNISLGTPDSGGGGSDTPSFDIDDYVNKAGGADNAMDGPFLADFGSEGSPGLSFNGDPDSGFFRETDNAIGLTLGGINRYSFATAQCNLQSMFISQANDITADSFIQINTNGNKKTVHTVNNDIPVPHAVLDLSVDSNAPLNDYGLRLIREPRVDQVINDAAPSAGSSSLVHRGIAPPTVGDKVSHAGNLNIDCQGHTTGNIVFFTGGNPDPNALVASKMRMLIGPYGTLRLGGGTTASPIEASGDVDSGLIACMPNGTTDYRSFGLAVNARDIVGIFNRTNSTGQIVQFKYNNTVVGSVKTDNGTSISIDYNSDYRLKQDVREVDDAIAKIKSLRPVEYRWKRNVDYGYETGFIAHEVQETGNFHYLVSGEKDGTQKNYRDPTLDEPAYQGLDYGKFTPILVAALQEALVKIESLEARVEALETVQ